MKKLLAILLLLLFTVVTVYGQEKKSTSFTYYITTDFPDKIMENLRKQADAVGGFVRYFDGKKIEMKIPTDKTETIITLLKKSAFIQDTLLNSQNHADELLTLSTKLKVKNDMLSKIFEIFKSSTMVQTLEVEQEVNDYVSEIEGLKGRLRYLENSLVLSEFTVYVNKQNYVPPASKVYQSIWGWINRLGLKQLLNY